METNSLLDHSALKTRYRDYQREVEREQLVRQFKNNQPKVQNRLLTRLGDWLVAVGQWLKTKSPDSTVLASSAD